MSPDMTFVGSLFCGVAVGLFLLTIYVHMEGNRVSATRATFYDLRRDRRHQPALQVWWLAFRIAMGRPPHGPSYVRRTAKIVPIR